MQNSLQSFANFFEKITELVQEKIRVLDKIIVRSRTRGFAVDAHDV